MPDAGGVALSVVAEGSSDQTRFASLTALIETSIIEVADGSTSDPARLKRVADEAPSNWILIAREGERVGPKLAGEIVAGTSADPRAWGYRIGRTVLYCGLPLLIGRHGVGEVRLFHRRRGRLQSDGRMKVQGTVVRLSGTFEVVVHESEREHIESLERSGRRRVGVARRLTRWAISVVRGGRTALGAPARSYLWIEAGWK